MYRYLLKYNWERLRAMVLLALGTTIFSSQISAQILTNYSIPEGLPSPEVYDIEFDQRGLMWLTTDRGVASYDGYNFTSYNMSDGLSDNTNFEIIKTDSILWFTGYNGTITYYDGTDFIQPTFNDTLLTSSKGWWIEHIIPQKPDVYYAITKDLLNGFPNQLLSLNLSKGTFEFISYEQLNMSKLGDKYLVDNEAKICYSIESKKYYILQEFRDHKVIVPYPNFILATKNYFELINANQVKQINTKIRIIETTVIDDRLLLCTENGILEYDFESDRLIDLNLLSEYLTTSIKKDSNNQLWISTQNNGIFKVTTSDIKSSQLVAAEHDPRNLYTHNENLIVTSRNSGGIRIFDKSKNKIFSTAQMHSALFHPSLIVNDSILYTCNLSEIKYNKSLNEYLYNPQLYLKDNWREYQKRRNNADYFNNYRTKEIDGKFHFPPHKQVLKLNDGTFLSGSKVLFRHGANREYSIKLDKINNTILSAFDCLHLSNDGTVIICSNSVIYEITDLDNEIISPILNIRVNKVLEDNEYIYFGTIGHGLIMKHIATGQLDTIDASDGLISNLVNDIYIDNKNRIWVATNYGLNVLEKTNGRLPEVVNLITTTEGLLSNYIIDVIEWNDEIWVLTEEGFNYFNYDDLILDDHTVPLYIGDIDINDQTYLPGPLDLDYDQNDINISYSALDYTRPAYGIDYRYALVGKSKDTNWVETKTRQAIFTDLDHGKYEWILGVKNNNNEWSSTSLSIPICINPHFTQTFWFRLLMFLLFCLVVFYVVKFWFRYHDSKIQSQQALQRAELRAKAAELNTLRNQMNPHFIYNTLNSIQNFIFQNNPVKANYLLSRFSKLMRSSLEFSKLENIDIATEVNFLNNYLQLETVRFGNLFEYNIDVSKDIADTTQIPSLVIQPLIENCLKHGFANRDKQGIIDIIFKKSQDYILVEVLDNGKGLNDKIKQNNNRVSSTQIINDRLAIINEVYSKDGWLKIQNRNGNLKSGTQVNLKLPILN